MQYVTRHTSIEVQGASPDPRPPRLSLSLSLSAGHKKRTKTNPRCRSNTQTADRMPARQGQAQPHPPVAQDDISIVLAPKHEQTNAVHTNQQSSPQNRCRKAPLSPKTSASNGNSSSRLPSEATIACFLPRPGAIRCHEGVCMMSNHEKQNKQKIETCIKYRALMLPNSQQQQQQQQQQRQQLRARRTVRTAIPPKTKPPRTPASPPSNTQRPADFLPETNSLCSFRGA